MSVRLQLAEKGARKLEYCSSEQQLDASLVVHWIQWDPVLVACCHQHPSRNRLIGCKTSISDTIAGSPILAFRVEHQTEAQWLEIGLLRLLVLLPQISALAEAPLCRKLGVNQMVCYAESSESVFGLHRRESRTSR